MKVCPNDVAGAVFAKRGHVVPADRSFTVAALLGAAMEWAR